MIRQYLFQTDPFVFIDVVKNCNNSMIEGEVCFTLNKYLLNNRLDFLDLVESLAQLSGIHLSQIIKSNAAGYIAKVASINNLEQDFVYDKRSVFFLNCKLLESVQDYYNYVGVVFFNNKKILEVNFSIILSKELLNNLKNNSGSTTISDCYKAPLFNHINFINNVVHLSFNKNVEFLQGHFDQHPIVPGIYIVKTCLIVLSKYFLYHKVKGTNFASPKQISNIRFYNSIKPDEEIMITVHQNNSGYSCFIASSLTNEKKSLLQINY